MSTQCTQNLVKEAITLATTWQNRANQLMRPKEKTRHIQLARLLANPIDKVILTKLIDQSFRSNNNSRVADQIHSLLTEYGIPGFFSPIEKLLMALFLNFGRYFPDIAVPQVIKKKCARTAVMQLFRANRTCCMPTYKNETNKMCG